MALVQLTQGRVAIVDEGDVAVVSGFAWYALRRDKLWHAATKRKGHAPVYMHRLILGAKPSQEVDHENGDGLDNRRSNIRLCTKRENARNRRSGDRSKTSRYHGVCLTARGNRWRVQICAGRPGPSGAARQLYVGTFRDEVEAARAYDRAALLHFGPFAMTNFPREVYEHADV